MQDLTEKILLYRIRTSRDQQAFGRLFDTYKQELYRFARSRLRSAEDADDLVAHTFSTAWNIITTSHGEDKEHHFRGLIYHIARWGIADIYRRKKDDVSVDALAEAGVQIADKKQTPEKIEAVVDVSMLEQYLDRLKPDQKEVIVLRYFQGMEYSDIAERMEKNVNAVRVMLHRALKELRTYL